MTRKKIDTDPEETISTCACPKCGSRFRVAVRPIVPKVPPAPDPRQLPLFEKKRRKQASISEILGDE